MRWPSPMATAATPLAATTRMTRCRRDWLEERWKAIRKAARAAAAAPAFTRVTGGSRLRGQAVGASRSFWRSSSVPLGSRRARRERGTGIDWMSGTNNNASGRVTAAPTRKRRPAAASPATSSPRPSALDENSRIMLHRWTPPIASGAARIVKRPAAWPARLSQRSGTARRLRERRDLRAPSPAATEEPAGPPGSAISEDAFVDNQHVAGQHHHVLRPPLGDVGHRIDVGFDLAGHLTAQVHGVLGGDAREPAGAGDRVDDRHLGIVRDLSRPGDLAKDGDLLAVAFLDRHDDLGILEEPIFQLAHQHLLNFAGAQARNLDPAHQRVVDRAVGRDAEGAGELWLRVDPDVERIFSADSVFRGTELTARDIGSWRCRASSNDEGGDEQQCPSHAVA